MSANDYEWEGLVTAYPNDGTPTQENVDQSFKFFVDILIYLDGISDEIESYVNASFQERKLKIERIKSEVLKLQKKVFEKQASSNDNNGILNKLKERLAIIEPLIKPPSSIDDVVGYCKKIADYFLGPYTSLLKCITFYTQYITKMAEKINAVINALINTLTLLETELTNIENVALLFGPNALSLSIADIEKERLSRSLSLSGSGGIKVIRKFK